MSYSLEVEPRPHFLNWQQDPFGNWQARVVFPGAVHEFVVTVDLVAALSAFNPFDFFVEDYAGEWPFEYERSLEADLRPYLRREPAGPRLQALLASLPRGPCKTVDFLVTLNQRLQREVRYLIRLEPGVQTPEDTLAKASGSCRDSGWLLVQSLRHIGLAARFVSGYLIQLEQDVKSLDGPSGPERDFTDLHAWAEVFVPGAGWLGLDPTSGLFAAEGHLPLAATPEPQTAAAITGPARGAIPTSSTPATSVSPCSQRGCSNAHRRVSRLPSACAAWMRRRIRSPSDPPRSGSRRRSSRG